jgi:plastocyanin
MGPRLLATLLLGLAVAGCGDTGGSAPAPTCHEVRDGEVEITARDLAWDTDCLEAPADASFTIVVRNEDVRVNHNLHVPSAPGSPATDLVPGPVIQELPFDDGLAAGSYEFLCDIHPTMVGTLEVVDPPDP